MKKCILLNTSLTCCVTLAYGLLSLRYKLKCSNKLRLDLSTNVCTVGLATYTCTKPTFRTQKLPPVSSVSWESAHGTFFCSKLT